MKDEPNKSITKTADTASRGMFAYVTSPIFGAGPGDEAKQHEWHVGVKWTQLTAKYICPTPLHKLHIHLMSFT